MPRDAFSYVPHTDALSFLLLRRRCHAAFAAITMTLGFDAVAARRMLVSRAADYFRHAILLLLIAAALLLPLLFRCHAATRRFFERCL